MPEVPRPKKFCSCFSTLQTGNLRRIVGGIVEAFAPHSVVALAQTSFGSWQLRGQARLLPAQRALPELPPEGDPAAAARGMTSVSLRWEIESDGSDIDLVDLRHRLVVRERHHCGPLELRDAWEAEQRRNSRGPPGDGPAAQPLDPPPPPPPPDGGLAHEARLGQLRACAAARAAVDNLMRELGVASVPAPSSGWILMRDPKR